MALDWLSLIPFLPLPPAGLGLCLGSFLPFPLSWRYWRGPSGHIHAWSVHCKSSVSLLPTVAPGRVGGSSYSHVKDLFGALVLPFLCLTLFIEIVHRILLKTKAKVNRKIFMVCGGLAAADQLWKMLPLAVQDGEGRRHSWATLWEFLPCFPGIPIPSLSLVGSVRLCLSLAE